MPRTKTTSTAKTNKTKSSSKRELQESTITEYVKRINQSSRQRARKGAESSQSTDEDRPSSSAGVRTKKGLSVRNGEQMDSSRRKDRGASRKNEVEMPQQQSRKRKMPQSPSKTLRTITRNQAKRQKERSEKDQYSERTVSAQAASRWKSLSKATRQFVMDTLDSAIVNVLNETRPSHYDDVQDRLNILRQRIVGALSAMTVPSIRQPDYRHMEDHCHSIEVSVAEASNHLELLEKEIDEQSRQIEEKEKLLEELKTNSEDQSNRRKFHPLLQEDSRDTLELPAVKASKAKPDKASFSSSSASPSRNYHRRLVDALKKWQSQDTHKDIGTFMDTLSNVTSTL